MYDDLAAGGGDNGTRRELFADYVVVATGFSSDARDMAAEALAFLSDTPCKLLHAHSATATDLLHSGDFVTVVGDGPDAVDAASSAALLLGAASVRLVVPQHRVAPLVMDGNQLLSSARRRALAASLQPHYAAPQPGLLGKALRAPAKRRFWALVSDHLKPSAQRSNADQGHDMPAATAVPPSPSRAAPASGAFWRLRRGNTLSPAAAAAAPPAAAGKPLVLWAPSLRDPRFMPYLDRSLREALMGQLGDCSKGEGEGELGMYRGLVAPDVPGLAFIGSQQGTSGELLELQAQWLAAHLAGRLALPPAAAMRADVAAQRAWRSGALAHPLMSAGGSLARRHEQCCLEQLRQDLRGAGLAASAAPSAVASATAGHQSAVSATSSRLPDPVQLEAVVAASRGAASSATAGVGALPANPAPLALLAQEEREEEDGEELDEELENTFGVASPPSFILHAGRGGRRGASTIASQSHRGGRHSQQRRSDSCVDAGTHSARSAVLGGSAERSSAASAGTSACGSQVLSGSGERTSAGSTTSSASTFFARLSSRVSWFSSITGGAGGGGGLGSSPPLSPDRAPPTPAGGGQIASKSPPASLTTLTSTAAGALPSLASPTSPPTLAERGEGYGRAGSSINANSSTATAMVALVRPAARTRRGASAAAAVPAAALVPPSAGARARTAMNSAAVAAAAHAAAARARAVTQQVAAAMQSSAAARGRELGLGAGVGGAGDASLAPDGRTSAPTRPAQRHPVQEQGEDEDAAESGPTRHTYSGPFHTTALAGHHNKASASSERRQVQQQHEPDERVLGLTGQLTVPAPPVAALQQQMAAMAVAEAAVTPLPAPPPVRLPPPLRSMTPAAASPTTSAAALNLGESFALGHRHGSSNCQLDPNGDLLPAAPMPRLGLPTPHAVNVNTVARRERNESNGSSGVPPGTATAAWHAAGGASAAGATHASVLAAAAAESEADGSTASGHGAFASGLLGVSGRRLLGPVTAALRQRQQQQQRQAHPQSPSAEPKLLPAGREIEAVQFAALPPPLLLQLDEADDACGNSGPSVHSGIMPAAALPAAGKLQPDAAFTPARAAASPKSVWSPRGSSLAQALGTCLPFGQPKKSAARQAPADAAAAVCRPDGELAVTSAAAQGVVVAPESGGTGCAALASGCGLASRRPMTIGGAAAGAGHAGAAAVRATGAPGTTSSLPGPNVLVSRSSVTALADPPQEGTPVAELIDEAERSARRMSRLMRQRRAVSSTGEDPSEAGPDSNGTSGHALASVRPVTRFSYNGAGPMNGGAGQPLGSGTNLRRGYSSGLWGVGGSHRTSGGGAGSTAAMVPQSTRRTSGGGRSSRASSGAFRVSNCGGGSLYVSGPGGGGSGGGSAGGPYGSGAAADGSSGVDCAADLSIWGDGAALDLMTSQIEALRTHLRDPRVVPFPSVGAASPPIASPSLPAPRSSRPSPSPSPRLSQGWPRSPSSAATPAAAIGVTGQPVPPASMPSPPMQKLLHTAHSMPDPQLGAPQGPHQMQPYPSPGAPTIAPEPFARRRPVLRSHPGHPERQTGGAQQQPSASAAQVLLPQAQVPPRRQATLPIEALTWAPTSTPSAAVVAAASRSLPTTPQAPQQPCDPQLASVFQRVFPPVASAGALEALPSIGSRVAPAATAAAAAAVTAAAAAARNDAADWTPFSSFRNAAVLQQPELDSTCLATAAFISPDGDEPGLAATLTAASSVGSTAAGAATPAGTSDAGSRAVCKRRSVPDLRALQRLSTIPEHRRNQPTSANTLTESETETGSGIAGPGAGGGGLTRSFSGGISFTCGAGAGAAVSSARSHSFRSYLGLGVETQTGVLAAAAAAPAAACNKTSTGLAVGAPAAVRAAPAVAADQELGGPGITPGQPSSSFGAAGGALGAHQAAGGDATSAGVAVTCRVAGIAHHASSGTAQGSMAPAAQPTKAAPPQLVSPVEPGTPGSSGWPAAVSPHLPQLPLALLPPPMEPIKTLNTAAASAAGARLIDERPAGQRQPAGLQRVGCSTPPGTSAAASMLLLLPELPPGDGYYSSYPHTVPNTPTVLTPFSTAAAPCSLPVWQPSHSPQLQPSQAPLQQRTSRTSAVAAALTGLLSSAFSGSLAAGGGGGGGGGAVPTANTTTLRPRLTRQSTGGASMASLFRLEHRPSGIAANAVTSGRRGSGGGGAHSRSGGGAATGWLDSRTSAPAVHASRRFLLGMLGGGGIGGAGNGAGSGGAGVNNGVGGGLLSAAAENAVLPYSKRLSSGLSGLSPPSVFAAPSMLPPSSPLSPPLSPTGPSAGPASLCDGGASRRSLLPPPQQPQRSSAAAAPAHGARTSGPSAPANRGRRATVPGAGFGRQSCLMEFDGDDVEEAEPQHNGGFPESAAAAAAAGAAAYDGRRSAPPLAQHGHEPPRCHIAAAATIMNFQGSGQTVPTPNSSIEAGGPNLTAAQRAHHTQHAATSSLFGEEESWPNVSTGGGVFMLSGVSPDAQLQPSLLGQAQTLAATAALPVAPLPPGDRLLSPFQAAATSALQGTAGAVLQSTYAQVQELPQHRTSHDFGFRCYGNTEAMQPPDGAASSSCQAPRFSLGDTADTNLHSLLVPPPADLSPLPPRALPLRRATMGGVGAASATGAVGGPSAWSNYSSCGGGHPKCLLPGVGSLGPFTPGPFRSAASCGAGCGVGADGSMAGVGEEKRGSPAWLVRHASEARQEQLVTQISSWLREALKQKNSAQ
ncbi:hypothetical protein HXX76_011804 [Chlamydomonas incerta]|uniref:Uncharacterized protein n=1 Tax=Chlamydomonas incerta TaxID=51695 RepID=A0A835SJ69_CHLIN|nr:hypothetical protein HXX76_011804 [Chlamydomonas incerta]|eukprot:KAG2428123.1 hypothetical protein HXX76_011804 [Chlamydomonas incerta]